MVVTARTPMAQIQKTITAGKPIMDTDERKGRQELEQAPFYR